MNKAAGGHLQMSLLSRWSQTKRETVLFLSFEKHALNKFRPLSQETTLQTRASTPTGLRGRPAARPPAIKVGGWGRGCWKPSWTPACPACTHRTLSPAWVPAAARRVRKAFEANRNLNLRACREGRCTGWGNEKSNDGRERLLIVLKRRNRILSLKRVDSLVSARNVKKRGAVFKVRKTLTDLKLPLLSFMPAICSGEVSIRSMWR